MPTFEKGYKWIVVIQKRQFLVMSDQDIVFSGTRRTNRLNLDSEEEQRLQAEERAREQQHRQRKEDRRRRREEQARVEEEEAKRRQEQQIKYEKVETMVLEDSDSNDSFERVERKIRRAYPQFRGKEEFTKKRNATASEDSQESQDEQSSEEKKHAKSKKSKVQRRQRREQEDKQNNRQSKQKVVKVEEVSPKERLVREVAIRWWFCLPEWPPVNYPYESQLAKMGYRLISQNRFKMQENSLNGLLKVAEIDGFVGVFRSKQKLIDLRPRETAPSLKLLRSKSTEQLTDLLRIAMKAQIIQLHSQQYHPIEQLQLLQSLQQRYKQIC